jgi:hypothetical protein
LGGYRKIEDMITTHKLYIALKQANVPEDAAAAAAEEVAELLKIRDDLNAIRADVAGLKWMFGFTWGLILLVLAVLGRS